MAHQIVLTVLQKGKVSLYETMQEVALDLVKELGNNGDEDHRKMEALDLLTKAWTCAPTTCKTTALTQSVCRNEYSNTVEPELFDLILMNICCMMFKTKKYQKHCGTYRLGLQLLETCYTHASGNTRSKLYDLCLKSLVSFNTEKHVAFGRGEVLTAEDAMDIHTTIDVLAKLIEKTESFESNSLILVFNAVVMLLTLAESHVSGKVIGTIVPKLLNANKDCQAFCLQSIWETVIILFEKYGQSTYKAGSNNPMNNRPFLVLCGLADWFFPVDRLNLKEISITNEPMFWVILQSGFYHESSLSRKRALYLLKRVLDITESSGFDVACRSEEGGCPVFWWNSEYRENLAGIWQDFLLLMETLEEKQVHVIKPLMPRLEKLIQASSQRVQGHYMLHTSWVCALVQRIANHDSAVIRRWGVTEILQVDMTTWPLLQQNGSTFLCGPFVTMLCETAVYYKMGEGNQGSCPAAGQYLTTFFTSCMSALSDTSSQAQFLGRFVHAMSAENWSGPALILVLRGMAQLSVMPLCDKTVLGDIRELLADSMRNLEVHFRGAVQCYFASIITILLDQEKVGPEDLASFIGMLRIEESFQRGTTLWAQYVSWFQAVATRAPHWSPLRVRQYIENIFVSFTQNKASSQDMVLSSNSCEMLPAARYLLLACDANILPRQPRDGHLEPLSAILRPLVDILLSVNSHVYMSTAKADHALLGLITVFQEANGLRVDGCDKVFSMVSSMIKECLDEILLYISRRMTSDIELREIDSVALYVSVLKILCRENMDIFSSAYMSTLVAQSAAVLQTSAVEDKEVDHIKPYVAMVIQGTLASILLEEPLVPSQKAIKHQLVNFWQARKPENYLAKPNSERLRDHWDAQSGWGRVSADFICNQWHCVQLVLATVANDNLEYSSDTYTEWCVNALDVVSGEAVVPVLRSLQHLISKVCPEVAMSVMDTAWRKLQEEKRTSYFWPSYKAFIPMAFHHKTLGADGFKDFHTQLATKVFDCGEEKAGVVNILASHLCHEWQLQPDGIKVACKYTSVILLALTFGTIHSKGKRFQQDITCFLQSLGESLAINQLRDTNANEDTLVRVSMLSFLSKLEVRNPDHRQLAQSMLRQITQKHIELIRMKTYRNFSNSLVHREKHRLVVAILVLEPFVAQEDVKEEIVQYLLEMLNIENQPSVRTMVEWALVRLILRDQAILSYLLAEIDVASEKKTSCLCSAFTVITHVTKHIENKQQQEALMLKTIPLIMPWCTTHQFNSRTYAQASLMCMWETCKERHLEAVLQTHSIIDSFMNFQKKNINNSRTTQRLLDNFFFHFDPIKDYSMQTLVLTLPKLSCIIDEEWIGPQSFITVDPTWISQPSSHNLPLFNERNVLDGCEPGSWKVKFVGKEDDEVRDGDVQKKMIPWRSMLPQQDLDLGTAEDIFTKSLSTSGLVLVTSLIDKVPNLGGLCRTSEIFGVSEFVISNLRFVEDKAFETLSVTAHKWIPIKEVKVHLLRNYLMEMKSEGYTLVGVEQTANSVSLTDYKFPSQTLLLLGNEKEGIPVDLIQLLDVCVEIPQQGVIRSLNVHVSGALFVWEYTRQHLLAAKQEH